MKRSELKEIIREVLNDATDPIITKVGEIAKKYDLVAMRKPLEGIFKKKDIDFVMSPVAHFRIKHGGKTLVIVNKKYADDAELIVGEKAIGSEDTGLGQDISKIVGTGLEIGSFAAPASVGVKGVSGYRKAR